MIELVPDGDEEGTRQLAQLNIVNDGTGTASNGHYDAVLTMFDRDGCAFVKTARIEGFDRDMPGVMLVSQALLQLMPYKRTMSLGRAMPKQKPAT